MECRSVTKYILKTIFALCFCFNISVAQNTKIDSLRKLISEAKHDSIKIKLNYELGRYYLNVLPDSTIAIAKRALKKLEDGNKILAYDFNSTIGNAYLNKGNYSVARVNFNKALDIALKLNERKDLVSKCYVLIGISYYYENLLYDSFKYYKKGLEGYRAINYKQEIVRTLNNIGIIYESVNDYDRALKYYLECLKICEDISCDGMKGNFHLNLGVLYLQLEKYDLATESLQKANEIYIEYNDDIGIAYYYRNSCEIKIELKQYKEAIRYCKKALEIMNTVNSTLLHAPINYYLSVAYQETNLNLSESYALKAYHYAKKQPETDIMEDITKQLLTIYTKKGQYKEANTYANIYAAYKDSITEKKLNKVFLRDQLDFEIKEVEFKKDLELAELKNASQEKEYNMNLAQERSNFMWLGLLVLAMVFYVIMITIQKRKIKKIMAENIQLETRVEEIETSIANDLHDNFGNRLAGVLTSYNIVKEINKNTKNKDPNFKKFSKNIENNLMSLNGDIKDLLWAMNPDNNEFKTIIRRLKMIFKGFESRSDVKIRLSHAKTQARFMMPKLANRQLVLILKEVVNNAIKHSKTDYIDISIFIDRDNHLIIDCVDYGIGFDIDKLSRINGLNHLKERAQLIKFNVEVNSKIGKGTKIALKSIYPLKRTNFKNVS